MNDTVRPTASNPGNSGYRPTILVVDDTEDIRDLVSSVLQDTYTIRPAFDGRSALRRALEKPAPDLILLDVDMPGASGHDVCRALKVTAATAEIPVIFLTSKDEPADVVKGFQLGAADYITKPFDVQELRLRVRNALKRVSQGSLTNPVSGLPEGALVDERLSEVVHKSGLALLHISIRNHQLTVLLRTEDS